MNISIGALNWDGVYSYWWWWRGYSQFAVCFVVLFYILFDPGTRDHISGWFRRIASISYINL